MIFTKGIETLVKNAADYEVVVTILGALVGVVVTFLKGILTMYEIAMSSPIEVTLMRKKEQHRYKNSKFVLLWSVFLICLIYLGVCSLFFFPDQNQGSMDDLKKQEENVAIERPIGSVGEYEEETEKELQMTNENMEEKPDVLNALIFLFGFFGIICIGTIFLILYAVNYCIRLAKLIKNSDGKNVKWYFIGFIFALIPMILFLKTGNFWFFGVDCVIVWGIAIYLTKRNGINKTIETLKAILYIFIFFLIVGINDIYVWNANSFLSYFSLIKMVILSMLLALVICLYIWWAVNFNTNLGQARVSFFDNKANKELYLYFRFNDDFFVAGEEKKIDDCEGYYLIKIENILGERLKRMSIEMNDCPKIYGENIILQLDGESDIILENVIKKISKMLQENNINKNEYRETKIYIKHKERMVYFYLPNEKINRDRQQFSI